MADSKIQQYLDKIKTAVYGKDVRQSIHDAIHQCYEDGSAGAIDLEVRDDIKAINSRLDSLTTVSTVDRELIDIRNGHDGTIYSSAGTAVREQVKNTHTIEVGTEQPTRHSTQLWINPDSVDTFIVPEILDDNVGYGDTWSSQKIAQEMVSVGIKWFDNRYINAYGIEGTAEGRMLSDYIPCPEGIDVTFVAETNHYDISALTFYDGNKQRISAISNVCENGVEYTTTTPEGTRFIRLSTGDDIGWELSFSGSPIFKCLEKVFSDEANFYDIDYRIAYDHVINGIDKGTIQKNSSLVTKGALMLQSSTTFSVSSSIPAKEDENTTIVVIKQTGWDGAISFTLPDGTRTPVQEYPIGIDVSGYSDNDEISFTCYGSPICWVDYYGTESTESAVTIAPGGYHFLAFDCSNTSAITYVGVKYDRDERINIGFSENGIDTTNEVPTISTKNIDGYEVAKICQQNTSYPYAIIRLDNRNGSTPMMIFDVKVIDGSDNVAGGTCYVAPTGSDSANGSLDYPVATVNKALLSGASNICVMDGEYEQTIDLGLARHSTIKISSYTTDGRPTFISPISYISEVTSADLLSGYNNVYCITTDKRFADSNIWIFVDGVSDPNTLIDIDERHPLQRGQKYRCNDIKLSRCTATTLGDVLDELASGTEYKWYADAANSTLYFSLPTNIFSGRSSVTLKGSFGGSLFNNPNRKLSLNVSGIECKYMAFDVSKTTNSVIKDCKASNVLGSGAFIYNHALSCEFIRCEASRCFNGSNGDGFNAHSTNTGDPYSKQTTVSLVDCWSHDNNDDGYSDHERSEITIIGGLYEYNGKGGIVPSYGSHCSCYNVYSRKNYAGFYYTGTMDAAEGGEYGQLYCSNCVAEANIRGGTKSGFRVDGDYNSMTLVNCKSINNENAYVIGNTLCKGKLVDCTAIGSLNITTGDFDILESVSITAPAPDEQIVNALYSDY